MLTEREADLRSARARAQQEIQYFGIERPEHIRLEAIANARGVELVSGQLQGSVARLVRVGDRGRIRVSDDGTNRGRWRFSVAHELGHHVLRHVNDCWLRCAESSLMDFTGRTLHEAQANVFAAELLLPSALVRRQCEVSPVNLDPVIALANQFGTSVTAACVRFVELSSEACALVYAHDGRIKWTKKSSHLYARLHDWGSALSKWSLAYDYFAKGSVNNRPEHVDVSAWIESGARANEIVEHVMPIPSLNSTLSILWLRGN